MSNESISFLLAQDIKEIFENSFNTQLLNGFSHSRIFPDGSRAELWTDKDAMKHTHVLKRYTTTISHAPKIYNEQERYVFLEEKIEFSLKGKIKENYISEMREQKDLFNHDNTFIVSDNTQGYNDYYCFYGPKEEKQTKTYIINHLANIEKYIAEYSQKAKHMIKRAEEDRLVKPWIKTSGIISPNLTTLEREIAQVVSNDLTDIEVAKCLGKSVRTVQSYMIKLKDKYRALSKKDLIIKLRIDSKLFRENE